MAAEGNGPAHKMQLFLKGYKMVLDRLLKSVIVVLALAFVVGFGGRLLPETASGSVARLFKYQVVTMGPANTVYEYEKLLNDMAFQGWTFDHMVADKEWVVFRK